ncbi:FAD-dependent monooxygenase [Streptomyces sp. NPDC047017]|uniref:FAD-dependent monooxygenase n=1 Tax=Streptomyces sp. NPDC047017 TaxID=3155024 RepID=UPI00340DF933
MAVIVVAGGGIGGLAAAVAVAARGHRVTVLERGADFTELGAGIQLGPNGFAALDRLGVGEAVRERAIRVDALVLRDGTSGAELVRMPVADAYRARFGNPYAVVHRVDLYRPLLAACRASDRIELRTSAAVVGYARRPGGVSALLADGGRVDGDALIGADGIRSAVRGQLVGDGAPRVSGHTIYRSVIPMAEVPARLRQDGVTLWAGPRWHLVHYAIAGGTQLNLAAIRDDGARRAVSGVPADTAFVRSRFPRMAAGARALLELGRDWRTWVLCDREPVAGWTDGPVALLGDAAHPMLQYAAQGACMALEDAVVLGRHLDGAEGGDGGDGGGNRDGGGGGGNRNGEGGVPERLAAYCAERRARTARAQVVARSLGEQLYHPVGDAARARDAMLSRLTVEDLHDKVSWLHGGLPEPRAAVAAGR